jgi:Ribosomal RNA adenine dimethylase
VKATKGVIKHFDLDGWDFDSYAQVITRKIINPEIQDQSNISPSLLFVGNVTEKDSRRSDGLMAQLISFMYEHSFLYHFGRIRTLFLLQTPAWQHFIAPPGHPDRKKVTVMRELVCDARVVAKTTSPFKPVKRLSATRAKTIDDENLVLGNSEDVIPLEATDLSPKVFSILIYHGLKKGQRCFIGINPF